MRVIRSVAELRIAVKAMREQGLRIGFVPTMGFLHEGHASLIRQSTSRCDATIVSIFLNPTQFGPNDDLAKYPQDLEADQNLCLKLGVRLLFLPETQEANGLVDPGHPRHAAGVVGQRRILAQPCLRRSARCRGPRPASHGPVVGP